MSLPPSDRAEADALLTDLYLDALLAARERARDRRTARPPRSIPRCAPWRRAWPPISIGVHPSFRFEERLAVRLAEAAARLRLAMAAGAEASSAPSGGDPARSPGDPAEEIGSWPVEADPTGEGDPHGRGRPLLIGGALTSAALSIAGAAAYVAWRRARPLSPDGPRRAGGRPGPADPRTRPAAGRARLMPIKLPSFRGRRETYPPDLWTKCPSCEEMIFNRQLDKTLRVCPTCGHHFRLSAAARLEMLLDPGTFEERDGGLQSLDPLEFVDQKPYPDRVAAAQAATGMRDAAVWGIGRIDDRPVAICVMDFAFMGGSMGAVVGEKVTRAAEAALEMRRAAHHRLGVGWRPDAGGHARPDAAGQDDRRARARSAPRASRSSRS